MAQNKRPKKLLSAFIVLGLVSIILLSILGFSFKSVRASPAGTTINIVPSQTTVGTADAIIPKASEGGLPFNITVTVTDVTDLYSWQVLIYYFPSIIDVNLTKYPPAIPAENIFQGKQTVGELPPSVETRTKMFTNETAVNLASPLNPPTKWLWVGQHGSDISNTENMTNWMDIDTSGALSVSDIIWMKKAGVPVLYYRVASIGISDSTITMVAELSSISWASSLMGTEVPASGSGTLCQFTFMGLNPGSYALNFSRPLGGTGDTNLLDPDLNDIPFDVTDGSITVLGVPTGKELSTITLNVDKTYPKLGENVTITGSINPIRPNVDVTISYKPSGGSYALLAIVKTDTHSSYGYTWVPPSAGNFYLKAIWAGDGATVNATSAEKIISVGGGGQDFLGTYLPYIVVGIIVIVVVVVLLYWFKIRKK